MAGLFGGDQASAPAPKPPAPMPDSQSPAVSEASRNEQQRILQRAGRQSTILTTSGNRPSTNFDSYSSKTLGASG